MEKYKSVGEFARKNNIRLLFHPNQFVLLNSLSQKIVENSISELVYHGEVAELVGADVINIHLGRIYGDKKKSIQRFKENFLKLPKNLRDRMTIENDDKVN